MSYVLSAAHRYHTRGWSVIPVDHAKKAVKRKNWQQELWKPEDFDRLFGQKPSNIGILTGVPSHGLIDIDLDHPLAVELAPLYLPPTPAKFGHQSKPLSHWLYHCNEVFDSSRFKLGGNKSEMLVEIRSTGCQTIAPPSIHEGTNEPIEWENENALPAHTDATILHQAVKRLVAEVKRRLRVTTCSTSSVPPVTGEQKEQCADTNDSRDDPRNPIEKEQARQRCLRHMQVIRPYHNKDGSHRVFAYCCRGVEHDLTCDETIELIRQVVQSKPLPKQWSDHEIAKRYADAEGKCHRGIALLPSRHVPFPVHCDETTGKPILSARRTLSTAKGFLQTNYMRENDPLLIHFAGDWYRWAGNRYQVVDEITLQDQMLQYLHDALVESNKPGIAPFPFPANPRNAAAGLQTLRGIVHLSDISQQPSWLDANHAIHPANELLAFKSHLYHIPSSQILSPTPRLFNTHALDIELDEIDQVPVKWLEFLSQVFPDSLGSVALLQEWFGYCLTPDTSLQKMLLMCGPPRSGKGTIARVLEQLIGKQYTASPSVDSFTHIFGLEPLLNKMLAIINDGRITGTISTAIVDKLLGISGQDSFSVSRKHKQNVQVNLIVRLMFVSNELPRFNEPSGALANRFLILVTKRSFLGEEDTELTSKLLQELPGILKWALEGRERLTNRGRFVQTEEGKDVLAEMEHLASPVKAFVSECCRLGPTFRVSRDELYDRYRLWCDRSGLKHQSTRDVFLRDLTAAFHNIKRRRSTINPFYEGIELL